MRGVRLMVALAAVGGALAAATLAQGGSDAVAARKKPCPPKRTKTLDAGVGGLIYVAAGTSQRDGEQDRINLCSHRTRRHRFIGWDDCFNADQVGLTRFVGRFLAVSYLNCGPGGYESSIDLRRIANGRVVRSPVASPELRRNFELGAESGVDVTDLVARSDGALAWIVSVRNPQGAAEGTTRLQVRGSTGGSGSDLLADGEDIAPRSLALAGSTLYWTQGGAPRSATLP